MRFEVEPLTVHDLKHRLPVDILYMDKCGFCRRGRKYLGVQFVGVKRLYTWWWRTP